MSWMIKAPPMTASANSLRISIPAFHGSPEHRNSPHDLRAEGVVADRVEMGFELSDIVGHNG
jgi:hypothetical protein